MPGRTSTIVALAFALIALIATPAQAEDMSEPDATTYSPAFSDVADDHLFAASIRALLASGITRGCNDTATRFCPDAQVTRGQMAAFLSRALDLAPGSDIDFVDDDASTFEGDIERLAAAGITKGCNPPANDHYCPDEPITRGEMAAFLTRALPLSGDSGTDFVDDEESRFESSIELLSAAGVTKGCNPPVNDRFCPDDPVTRAQMAAFLTRALPLVVPPALPEGVAIDRIVPAGGTVGAGLEVCRETEHSLMVRSVTTAEIDAAVLGWEPSTSNITSGSFDRTTDRWYLPTGSECHTLQLAWDPHSNELVAPLTTLQLTSGYGHRFHPILRYTRLHAGADFRTKTGDPVFAAAAGVVVTAGSQGGYGNLVAIRHRGGLDTRYAHLSSFAVTVGETVEAGQIIGGAGCTGLCTGPHLHFETREFGQPVDPMGYLNLD